MNQHRLVVCPSVIETGYNSVKVYDGDKAPEYRGFYQTSRMVKAKGALGQDDRIDALAGACAHFLESLSLDTHAASVRHKEDQLQQQVEKFVRGCLRGFNSRAGGPRETVRGRQQRQGLSSSAAQRLGRR